MIPADETFDRTWPYPPHFTEVAGFRQHFVDEGPRDGGGAVVFLHGEPTWGYLWRHLIGPLSQERRVIVPDHMGFGKSATPVDRTYLAGEHIDNLEALLVGVLDLHDITLVMHDWGGPIGTGFALRHPDRIARVFATNTVLPLGLPAYDKLMAENFADSHWFRWASAAHANGTLEQTLGEAGSSVTHLMLALQTITRPQHITPPGSVRTPRTSPTGPPVKECSASRSSWWRRIPKSHPRRRTWMLSRHCGPSPPSSWRACATPPSCRATSSPRSNWPIPMRR